MGNTNEPRLPADLQEAWDLVLAHWEDDAAHKRFITLCSATGRLEYAGGAYRELKEGDPERRKRAAQQLDAVLAVAMRRLAETKTPRKEPGRFMSYVALCVSSGLLLLALWAFFGKG